MSYIGATLRQHVGPTMAQRADLRWANVVCQRWANGVANQNTHLAQRYHAIWGPISEGYRIWGPFSKLFNVEKFNLCIHLTARKWFVYAQKPAIYCCKDELSFSINERGAGRFVPWTFRTQVGWFVPRGFFFLISIVYLVFSYPKLLDLFSLLRTGRFVPMFCSFPILDLGFCVSRFVGFFQPVEGWTIRTQCFCFNFYILFGLFVPKLLRAGRFIPTFCHTWLVFVWYFFVPKFVRFIQPVEGWTIRTQCFFLSFFFFFFISLVIWPFRIPNCTIRTHFFFFFVHVPCIVWFFRTQLCNVAFSVHFYIDRDRTTSRKLLRIKVTPDLHLINSKNGGNLGLVLKMKNIACISILLTKHVTYMDLYLFKFVLYSVKAFKPN